MSERLPLRRCHYCPNMYRPSNGKSLWCRVCEAGLKVQPPEVQRRVRQINAEWDRAEDEYLEQPL